MSCSSDVVRRVRQGRTDTPRSAVRARLALAIAELAEAAAKLAAAQEPASRLSVIVAEASSAQGELAALRAAQQRALGAWLANGGVEAQPEPEPALIAAEQHCLVLDAHANAARTALADSEQVFQRWAAKVRDLQYRRDEALCGVAVEAAKEFAANYREALIAALVHEAILLGLRAELLRWGNCADAVPGALQAAAGIAELIAMIKRGAAVPHDAQAAQRLLAALSTDPDAALHIEHAQ